MEPLRFRFMLNYVEHDFLALPDQLRATLVIVSEDSPFSTKQSQNCDSWRSGAVKKHVIIGNRRGRDFSGEPLSC